MSATGSAGGTGSVRATGSGSGTGSGIADTRAPTAPPRVYLPGLHGLRFIAAAAVVVHHFEQFKKAAMLPHLFREPWVFGLGSAAVTWFFALSGFLITYLLLKEREATGTTRVLAFYARRALRIWPLYFGILVLGMFVLPAVMPLTVRPPHWVDPEPARLAAFVFFAPNVALAVWGPHRWAAHLWSIGTEEQFYLVWAPLFRALKARLPWFLGAVVVVMPCLRACAAGEGGSHAWDEFLTAFRIDCMAVGAAGAWLLHRRGAALAPLLSRTAFWIAAPATLLLPAAVQSMPPLIHGLQAAAFTVLALQVSSAPRCPVRLENAAIRFLGDISYGVYMFHPFVCFGVVKLMKPHWDALGSGTASALGHAACLALTVAIASVSYVAVERPILRWKRRFTVVESGTAAR